MKEEIYVPLIMLLVSAFLNYPCFGCSPPESEQVKP